MIKKRTYVAGHAGMVGAAIMRQLKLRNDVEIITKTRKQLDLRDQLAVREFFLSESPVEVYLSAARVGGIFANNTYPAEFIYDNLIIEANVIHEAFKAGVRRLLFLGSSCIYPRNANQPISENALLRGELEPTNEPYAIAKIAGIKLCESYNRQYGVDYRSVMPTNLYGPGDNYHPTNSHVIPALIRRFHEAKISEARSVSIWGSGNPRREFLYVDDLAKACLFVMDLSRETYWSKVGTMSSHINVGFGSDISIAELASLIKSTVGYQGEIEFDSTKPDGTMRKLLDSQLLFDLGWKPEISLSDGLVKAYENYLTFENRC